MAGEWIKIDVGTPDKPELIRIARLMGADRDLILGKLCRLWAWFDRNTVDGAVDGVTSTDVDAVVGMPGLLHALKCVGWCDYNDTTERVTLSNFAMHNGETAKQRALKNKRQARWRAGSSPIGEEKTGEKSVDGAASTVASTREEKRREEKNIKKGGASAHPTRPAPPTLEEVVQEFRARVSEPVATREAVKFWNHYEAVGWIVGRARTPMKKWKSSVAGWMARREESEGRNPSVGPPRPDRAAAAAAAAFGDDAAAGQVYEGDFARADENAPAH